MTRLAKTGGLGASSSLLLVFISLADLFLITSGTGLLAAAASIPHINPPPKNLADEKTPKKPTALWGYIEWAYGTPNDLDLWVQCLTLANGRQNESLISYKQSTDGWLDLSQDDQGKPSPENSETMQSNSNAPIVPPNTVCIFNVHHWAAKGGPVPMKGTLKVFWKLNTPEETVLANLNFVVAGGGAEMTLLRVRFDQQGNFDPDTAERYPEIKTKLLATAPVPVKQ